MGLRISIPMPADLTNRVILSADSNYWLRDYPDHRLQANSDGYWVALHIGAPRDTGNSHEDFPQAQHNRVGASRIARALELMLQDETFEDWCANFSYDTDSRKAEETYNACRDHGIKLRRMIGGDSLVRLRELFQDY